ncbi:MAG: glycosyltransferase family 1 protein [Verrucomicrobia bacterium]|nr:MAG: glycosyltransferase family 1 protein [Verrucomicrobiota bacterium]
MRRLRILQIFNRYRHFGGEEGSVYRIGDALQALHDVEYFLTSTSEVLGGAGWARVQAPLKALYNGPVIRQLERYQAAGRFDLWHIHNVFPVMSPTVYALAFKRGIPLVHYLHNYRLCCVNGLFLNHGKVCKRCMHGNFWPAFLTYCWHESRWESGLMGLIVRHIRRTGVFERVSQWIAISESQRALYLEAGMPAGKIRVVHHFLEPGGPPLPFRGAGDVIYVGRLSPEKGALQLLQAWRQVGRRDRTLYIVGEGPDRPRLEQYVAQHALGNVVFTGFLKAQEQAVVWEKALFCVVPSICLETFGMTVLESWARGRPVIVHDMGALPELIAPGQTGLIVNPERPEELAVAITGLLENPEQARVMGREGRRVLEERFSKAVWLAKMEAVYTAFGA